MSHEKFKSVTNPFKEYITFELSIKKNLPATPSELHILEERYLGKFSAHIKKILHIIEYTRPDLMYDFNCLSRHTYLP